MDETNAVYKVNYQYIKPGSQSTRSLSVDSDFPELLQEIYEVDKELREAEDPSDSDAGKPKVKWIMSSEGCSVTCGGGTAIVLITIRLFKSPGI